MRFFLDICGKMLYSISDKRNTIYQINVLKSRSKLLAAMRPVDHHISVHLSKYLGTMEEVLKSDILTIFSPILPGLEHIVKTAVEPLQNRKPKLSIILDTLGGTIEVAERIVSIIRYHYNEVDFLIPDRAMSAGTVFAMSGDRIFMNYFSCLGPIDPQVYKNGEFVPALSYLNQYERLCKKAEDGELNTVEFELVRQLDLGELDQFEQARQLSHDLLTDWLSTYKFKDWDIHSSTGKPVTPEEKKKRAKKIASVLSNNERWHSHGRMIPRNILTSEEIRLKIENIEDVPNLFPTLDNYVGLLKDYVQRESFPTFVHTREYF